MTLFDTNVLLDVATIDPVWYVWSENELHREAARKQVVINPIIYAELAPAFATSAELDRWLNPFLIQRLPLPYEAGWIAAQAYRAYRRRGGPKTSLLPDFYIGAQAEFEGHTLVTRDAARYRTYFPNVTLRTPP